MANLDVDGLSPVDESVDIYFEYITSWRGLVDREKSDKGMVEEAVSRDVSCNPSPLSAAVGVATSGTEEESISNSGGNDDDHAYDSSSSPSEHYPSGATSAAAVGNSHSGGNSSSHDIRIVFIEWARRLKLTWRLDVREEGVKFEELGRMLVLWLRLHPSERIVFYTAPAASPAPLQILKPDDFVREHVGHNGTVFCNATSMFVPEGEAVGNRTAIAYCLMMTAVGRPVMCAPPLAIPLPSPGLRLMRSARLDGCTTSRAPMPFSVSFSQERDHHLLLTRTTGDEMHHSIAVVLPEIRPRDIVLYHYPVGSAAARLSGGGGPSRATGSPPSSAVQPRRCRVHRVRFNEGGILSFDITDIACDVQFDGVLGIELELL